MTQLVECKHGLKPEYCSLCSPKMTALKTVKKRIPAVSEKKTVFSASAISEISIKESGYVVVRIRECANNRSCPHLGEKTRIVHIDGYPFLWAIKMILDLAPNLEKIQVIPTMVKELRGAKALIDERGVKVVSGHHRPDLAWSGEENRSPFFQAQAKFLKELSDDQKRMLEELVALGFTPALMTVRYFCLNDEEFIPQRLVSKEFGYEEENRYCSLRINAVLHYLDPEFKVSKTSKKIAAFIKQRIQRLRSLFVDIADKQRIEKIRIEAAAKLGIEKLPDGLPLARLEFFETILKLSGIGGLEELRNKSSKAYDVLISRFGIFDGKYKTLESVGELLGGITRERVRQLEEYAFGILGLDFEE